jgi:hypothetical protein
MLESRIGDSRPYLGWHKTHPRAAWELTGSGAAPVSAAELFGPAWPINLDVGGPYGHPNVIDAVARLYGVSPDRVLPVPGTSCGNFVALAVAADRGDIVLIEHPVYDPIIRAATFLDLQIRPLPREPSSEFGVDVEGLRRALDQHRPKAVALTNLHNPGGRRLTSDEMRSISLCCAEHDARLIVDEVYLDAAHVCLNEPRWTAAAFGDNVIVTSSLTKVYGLGGLRAGWLIASPRTIEKAHDIVDLLHADNPAPVADLAAHAFANLHRLEERYRRQHATGRRVFLEWLNDEERLGTYPNHGALFECVRLPAGIHSLDLNDRLVSEVQTQIVPGTFFGLDDHIRIGLAAPPDHLAEGLRRISRVLTAML